MTTATRNNVVAFPPAKSLEQTQKLSMNGVEKIRVNETHPAYANTAPSYNHPPQQPQNTNKIQKQRKLPESSFRLIETADATLETLMAAKSVAAGLKNGETVVLVSPENPEYVMRKLAMAGLDVKAPINTGSLIIFSSQPAIAGNLSLSTNYREVFGELFDLAGCPVDRVIVLKMDLLVNLESQYLAYASVSKFTQAAEEMGCKFVAQYSRNQSEAQDRLDAACSSLVNAYFVMKRGKDGLQKSYQLQAKNISA